MEMTINKLRELIEHRDELKHQLREADHRLADEVLRFDGTVQEALEVGLIRLNFTAPRGFYRMIHNK